VEERQLERNVVNQSLFMGLAKSIFFIAFDTVLMIGIMYCFGLSVYVDQPSVKTAFITVVLLRESVSYSQLPLGDDPFSEDGETKFKIPMGQKV